MARTALASMNGLNVQVGTGATAGAQHTATINTPFSKILHVSITYTEATGADLRTFWAATGGVVTVTDVVDKAFSYAVFGI